MNNLSDKSPSKSQENITKDILDSKYELFSSQVRFSVMLLLHTHNKVKVTDLARLLNINPGKLDHHIKILEKEDLLRKRVVLFPPRVQTIVEKNIKGEELFTDYLSSLTSILKQIEKNSSK